MTQHYTKSVIQKFRLPKWLRMILVAICIVATITLVDRFIPARGYVEAACNESKTIQRYDTLKLGCAILVLDWRTIDEILSSMEFTAPWNRDLYRRNY